MTNTATDQRGPVQSEAPANIDGEPAFVMDWRTPEQLADLGTVTLSRYAIARVTVEKVANRVRLKIATEPHPMAPADALPFNSPRPLIIRGDLITNLIGRLQCAHDAAIRAGMTRKGGIA